MVHYWCMLLSLSLSRSLPSLSLTLSPSLSLSLPISLYPISTSLSLPLSLSLSLSLPLSFSLSSLSPSLSHSLSLSLSPPSLSLSLSRCRIKFGRWRSWFSTLPCFLLFRWSRLHWFLTAGWGFSCSSVVVFLCLSRPQFSRWLRCSQVYAFSWYVPGNSFASLWFCSDVVIRWYNYDIRVTALRLTSSARCHDIRLSVVWLKKPTTNLIIRPIRI